MSKKRKNESNGNNKSDNNVTNETKYETILGAFKNETDRRVVSALFDHYYEGVVRALLSDDSPAKNVVIREVGRHIWRECETGSTEVTKMSHSVETLRMSELRKVWNRCLPSTLLLFSTMTGKERHMSGPIVAMISILLYVINSHANLFQKIVATVLLNGKCNPSTITTLHSYRLCIAYETLVAFLDNNTIDCKQIPKLIKAFQL